MDEKVKPVLLVWQEIPESIKLYLFTDLSEREFNSILKAHGTYINSVDETEYTNWLNNFMYDDESGRMRFEPILDDNSADPKVLGELPEGCVIVLSGFLC